MPKAEAVDVKEPKDVKRVAASEGIGKPVGEPIELAPTAGPKSLDKLPFFDMLAAMSAREWEDRMVYLYRQDKNIIKEDPKDNNYIDRVPHAFDEAYVKQKFGGGRFLAILKNTRINGAERKFSFRIEGEPIIQEDEVQIKKKDSAGSGSSEVTMLLDQVRDLTDKLLTQGQKSTGAEQVAITKSVEMLTEASKGALAIQQEAIKSSMSSSTGNPLTDKLLEATISRVAGGEQKGDDLERLVKLLALLKQLNPSQEAKPGLMGIVSELKALAEVAKEIGFKMGGAESAVVEGAAGVDWKTALAANIPSVLGTLTGWFQEWQKANAERNRLLALQVDAMRRGQVPPQQLPPAPVQTHAPATTATIAPPPPAAQPAPTPASALPANFAASGSQPATQPQPTPATDKVVEFPQQQPNAIQVDLSFIANLVRRCWDKQDSGDAAALVIKRLFGDDQFAQFMPYFNDVEQLKVFAAMDPQLAEIVNDEDFPVFLAEFVREMKRKEDEEEPPTPEPSA